MPYAVVQDIAASWEQYTRTTERLLDPKPEGLLVYVAGPTDEGYRTIGVWENESAWLRFWTERLDQAFSEAAAAKHLRLTARVFQPRHLVLPGPNPTIPGGRACDASNDVDLKEER